LNVAQSAISRQIQALEHELGASLLERRPRGVALTHAGELLYTYGRNATFHVERLVSELDALQGLRRGHVRIATIEALVPNLLPQAISRFLTQFPGITFAVEVLGTDRVVAAVKEGTADIGVAFSPQPANELHLVFRTREPLYAVVAPSHQLAKARKISVRDLVSWPVALPSKPTGSRMLFDAACRETHTTITPALETTSVELLHRFALISDGIGVMARHTFLDSLKSHKLVPLRFKESVLSSGTIDIVTLVGRHLPLAAEKFLIALRRELDSLVMPG